MKIKKETLRKLVLEELGRSDLGTPSSDSQNDEVQFMIQKMWIGEISENEHVHELCEILAPEALKEGRYAKFGINRQVRGIFEHHQQRIIEELQKIVDQYELEDI